MDSLDSGFPSVYLQFDDDGRERVRCAWFPTDTPNSIGSINGYIKNGEESSSMTIKRLGTTLALVLASVLIAAGAYASTVSYRLSTPGVV